MLLNGIELYVVIALVAIVIFYAVKWCIRYFKRIRIQNRISKSGIRDIDQMDGYQFEVYLEALFKKLGYQPQVTASSHDFGADLILKGKNKIVIQAKRYGFKNNVSISAVQEIHTAKTFFNAQEAWVITNSKFTKSAKTLAKGCNVKLLDRIDLQRFITKVNPDVTAKEIYHQVEPTKRMCPECGQSLVVREANQSKFFGCSSFPSCRHTEQINK